MRRLGLVAGLGIFACVWGCGGNGGGGNGGTATVTGTLTLPASAPGKEFVVLVDNDPDADNGYLAMTSGNCGMGSSIAYQIQGVPAGSCYVYAAVCVVSGCGPNDDLVAGDFLGFYGSGLGPPAAPNATVPSSGIATFDIALGVVVSGSPRISWVPNTSILTYQYRSGVLAGVTNNIDFVVSSASGPVDLSARVEGTAQQETGTFTVASGESYTASVAFTIVGRTLCSPLDRSALIVLSSPAALAETSMVVPPDYDADFNVWRCLDLSVGQIQVTGGGGSTGVQVADLDGTWLGSTYVAGTGSRELSITLDASGNLSQMTWDGVSTGRSAVVAKTVDDIFRLVFSDGALASLIVSSTASHAAFIDEDGTFGVLEKGAAGVSAYGVGDVVGTWAGAGHNLTASLIPLETWSSNIVVAGDLTFSGSDSTGGTFVGAFTAQDLLVGMYLGDFTGSDGTSGWTIGHLSADKSTLAVIGADTSGGSWAFPDNYAFELWTKQ